MFPVNHRHNAAAQLSITRTRDEDNNIEDELTWDIWDSSGKDYLKAEGSGGVKGQVSYNLASNPAVL